MIERLHVFAVNTETDLRHSHLTRAQGEATDLPPLGDWLGVGVDTDEIELFPIRDLGDMPLSDYITMAFAPERLSSDEARRLNALEGTVLLVPERALAVAAKPGAELTLIATLPLAAADHRADLPKAVIGEQLGDGLGHAAPSGRMGGLVWLVLVGVLAFAGLMIMWRA